MRAVLSNHHQVILFREPLPFSEEISRWLWLSLLGVIGLPLGDVFFFQSLIAVGARLGSLLLSLAPIFGSIIAWIIFGEILTALEIVGIVLALAGIAWVVLSHEEPPDTLHGHTRRGVLFGVLAGLGQAIGLVLSKQALSGGFSPFQANAIRRLAVVVFIRVWTAFEGKAGATFAALRAQPRVLWLIALGALVGPVLGVFSSLRAVQHAEVGVASTLMAWTKNHTFFYCYSWMNSNIKSLEPQTARVWAILRYVSWLPADLTRHKRDRVIVPMSTSFRFMRFN